MTWPEQAPQPAKALSASFSHAGHQDDRELGFEPIKHTARRLKAFCGNWGRWPPRKIAGARGPVWVGLKLGEDELGEQCARGPAGAGIKKPAGP